MNNRPETLIPKIGVIADVRIDTPDIKTFRVVTPDGVKPFEHRPGQCAMLFSSWSRGSDVFYYFFSYKH